jgi:hypothetical protein
MKTLRFLFTVIIVLIAIQHSQSQNLVQSFIEVNSTGSSQFGFSVSNAGDVNGDGYDDVIVGADAYSSSKGRSYIYYGGSSMDNVADVNLTGENSSDLFSYSVSKAGDLNNDGYDDVIVGAHGYSSKTGRSYIYFGGSSMDNVADITMTGEASNNYFGYSVSGAGDVNGDGFDDVIVGAYNYSFTTGRSYIYFGGSSMDNFADVIMTGDGSSCFGFSVSGAGDVNCDGYDDIIVGAYNYSGNRGRSYIYFGGSSMDIVADVAITGEGTDNYFGSSVSGAGDVNGDGYDDVIVGAYGYNSKAGRSYIYFGGSSMDDVADVKMTGGGPISSFGYSVSGAGDVNGDGYDDVIVGAYYNSFYTGRTYIYFGGNSMDNVADVMTGETTIIWNYFGQSVSGAGDVNGDGYDDVIVGAPGYLYNTGRSYIYFGGSSMNNVADVTMTGEGSGNCFGFSVSGAGDINGDTYDDVIVGAYGNVFTGRSYIYFGGSRMDNVADVIMTGESNGDYFGFSVSGAGDVNGDGYDDVIVGAPEYLYDTGRSYIYLGGSSMDNVADITLTGEVISNYFGSSVSGAGDVNGDGYDDVILGAWYYFSYTGRSYIYFGGSNMDNVADVTMNGEGTSNYFGTSVSGAGDVNGDGYGDVMVGAPGYSSGYSTGIGRSYIYFGGNSMDSIADVTMTGEGSNNSFGHSVSGAGDINNDGFDDVIVGANRYNSYTGSAYLYYGESNMDNTADVILTGEGSNNNFGISVSGAGDVNKDGYNDIIVGAPNYSSLTGRSYIFFGGSSMDNIADVTLTGEGSNNNFACSLSSAGDVNGDGYPEIIIGAYGYPTNGKAYLYNFKPAVQENLTLNDSTLAYGNIACYNALQNINVSEIPSVILRDGATATFIAGSSIRFLPGFYAESGSVMNAYITTDASFCDLVVPKSVNDLSIVAEVSQKPSDLKKGAGDIKLYPNPNSGTFTLELSNFGPQSTIVIYNLLGEKVAQFSHAGDATQPVNLEGIRKGVYMVEVADGKNRLMKKMIVK